ncbi:sulfite exporter TauE/SafE family protein [Idiomarina tyrosinivorans]|uniref:Sulfite exporter TauE/SafE family protein n=2 Tax=Idiomarina tyrosinivorans TaxID=1445662 RepID=A0A432ZUG9_9GAMM|nr:sulfite exporter TauE/SafE family protein [Idiomarina tyrosinivorans]
MGLAGAGHCFAMCGGLAAAIGMQNKRSRIYLYHLGRLSSYMLLGAIVAAVVDGLGLRMGLTHMVLRWVAGAFLIALGLYITNIWRGLVVIERIALPLWRRIQPLAQRIRRHDGLFMSYLAGAFWGWLPCGLVYSALTWAAISGNAINGALTMLFFGIGTLPAMLFASHFSHALRAVLATKGFRLLMGTLLIVYGLWTWAMLLMH